MMRKNEVHNEIKKFKVNLKKYGKKYAFKRMYMYLRSKKRMIGNYINRYGWIKIILWTTPIYGTVLLLSELENKEFKLTFNATKIMEFEQRLARLENES